MKRVLFLFVSALLAGTTYASNLSKDVIAMVTSNQTVSLTEQGQSLILEQPVNAQTQANGHYSHSSHSSHYSSKFQRKMIPSIRPGGKLVWQLIFIIMVKHSLKRQIGTPTAQSVLKKVGMFVFKDVELTYAIYDVTMSLVLLSQEIPFCISQWISFGTSLKTIWDFIREQMKGAV